MDNLLSPDNSDVMGNNLLDAKPVESINRMIAEFKSFSNTIPMEMNKPLEFHIAGKRQCIMLLAGHVDLCRPDHSLVLNSEVAPFIFGLSNLPLASHGLVLIPSEDAVLSVIPMGKACEIIMKKNLWRPMAELLTYISSRIYSHCTRMSQVNSYETVRTLLTELMQEPESIRSSMTALQYIQARCFLSRSGIMRILSALRTGSYITIENGKLIDLHLLPKKF